MPVGSRNSQRQTCAGAVFRLSVEWTKRRAFWGVVANLCFATRNRLTGFHGRTVRRVDRAVVGLSPEQITWKTTMVNASFINRLSPRKSALP